LPFDLRFMKPQHSSLLRLCETRLCSKFKECEISITDFGPFINNLIIWNLVSFDRVLKNFAYDSNDGVVI